MSSKWRAFFVPEFTRALVIRVLAVVVSSGVLFAYILTPFRIHGHSMAPTYRDGGFNFCNKLRFVFTQPQRRDVVAIRLAGESIIFLKRVVALQGDTVAFQSGKLLVNGRAVEEPYVKDPDPWTLSARTVEPGKVYVVGDNRRVPMQVHSFGQTSVNRIMGGPLW